MKYLIAFLLLAPLSAVSQAIEVTTNSARVSFDYVSEKTDGTLKDANATVVLGTKIHDEWVLSGSVPVSTLTTDNKMRDKHLKSKSFFHADEYPTMTFESTLIKSTSDGYEAQGKLTIKDITKDIVFSIKRVDNQLECATMIYATDFDVAIKKDREKSIVNLTVFIPIRE